MKLDKPPYASLYYVQAKLLWEQILTSDDTSCYLVPKRRNTFARVKKLFKYDLILSNKLGFFILAYPNFILAL